MPVKKIKATIVKMNRIHKEVTIYKSNELVTASYDLSLQEQRIVLVMASLIRQDDEEFKLYKIKITDFLEVVGLKSQTKYKDLQEITRNLWKKELIIRKKDGRPLQMGWLASAEYYPGYIELEFSVKLKPFLLHLKEKYTAYQLGFALSLKGKYSIRFYELMKECAYKKEKYYGYDELREILTIPENKYKQYGHFKAKIINSSQTELKKKTDISFTFKEAKKGRKVIGLQFFIKQIESKTELPAMTNIPLYRELQDYYCLTPKQAKETLKIWDENFEKIEENLKYIKKQIKKGVVKNIGAYTMKIITENIQEQSSMFHEKEKQKKQEKKQYEAEKNINKELMNQYEKEGEKAFQKHQIHLSSDQLEEINNDVDKAVKKKMAKQPGKKKFGAQLFTHQEFKKKILKLIEFPDFETWQKSFIHGGFFKKVPADNKTRIIIK
ncbi:MAG: replication initiation protein [Candidatus Marinimicrobia bacterium]|nr:replication initiation protein [Candidatus Neomarinimicrobiota bacterium]